MVGSVDVSHERWLPCPSMPMCHCLWRAAVRGSAGGPGRAYAVCGDGTRHHRDDGFGLGRYAQRFADAGLAVLMFDYRHFGLS